MASPVALEDRDADTPPCDSLAEAVVLGALLLYPERIPEYAGMLRPLLVFPEHRLLLTALEQAHLATPRADGETHASWAARFEVRWMFHECEAVAPGRGYALSDLISPLGPTRALAEWRGRRWAEARTRRPELITADFDRDWLWWLDRLQRVARARRLVEDAQRVAEYAWRGDVDGALAAAGRIDRQREVVRIDV